MGPIAASMLASALATRLEPQAIAMSGVCAGNPAEVALGDVVIAETAFAHDEGRRTATGFEPDHRPVPLDDGWLHLAQDLNAEGLASHGAAPEDLVLAQIVRTVSDGRSPAQDLLVRRLSDDDTRSALKRAEASGLIERSGATFQVTDRGKALLDEAFAYGEPAWATLPFRIHSGPMASGSMVVKDGVTWESLRVAGVRTIAALDMEAAAIAQVAHRLRTPRWVVVKGVMDHADPAKNDRVKCFAARAAAEVLVRFLERASWPSPINVRRDRTSINVVGDVSGSDNVIDQSFTTARRSS